MMATLRDHETDVGPTSLARLASHAFVVDIKVEDVVARLSGSPQIETDFVVAGKLIVKAHYGLAVVAHLSGLGAVLTFKKCKYNN